MTKLWQKSRPKGQAPRAEEIDLQQLNISSPTIIFLSGIFTTDNKPQNALDGIAEIENLIEGHSGIRQAPKIYALTHKNLRNIFNVVAYNAHPDHAYSKAAEKISKAVILPLVLDDKKQPLPEEKAAQNLCHVTLVGYSAGTVFGQEMFNAALKQMTQAGYAENKARDLLGEVVLISMATVSRPMREHGRFTTIYLAATNDIAVRLKERIWNPLRRIFRKATEELVIRPLSQTSLLITAAVHSKMWHWHQTPDGTTQKKDITPLLPRWMRIRSHHEMPHYTSADHDHSPFARIVLTSLVNALNRVGKMDVRHLLAPPDHDTTPENTLYKNRIHGAFLKAA